MTLRSTVLIFCSGALAGGLLAQWRAACPRPADAAPLPTPYAAPGWIHPAEPPIWPCDPGIYVPMHAYEWQFPPDEVHPSHRNR
jgi:hypothetical protein